MLRSVSVYALTLFTGIHIFGTSSPAQSLGGAFSKARSIVNDFKLSGSSSSSSADATDSTWTPPSYSEPPPSPIAIAIGNEIKKREGRIRKLSHRREIWRLAQEKLAGAMDWRNELNTWIEDSQTAQLEALRSCTTLLFAVAGPVEDAIRRHEYNASTLWSAAQKSRGRIEAIRGLFARSLNSGRTMPTHVRATLIDAETAFAGFVALMKNENEVANIFKTLGTISTTCERLITALEASDVVIKNRHDISIASHEVMEIVYDLMKDSGLQIANSAFLKKELVSASGAQITGLANFAFDYGLNSLRFYYAWNNVDDILEHMDDTNRLSNILNRQCDEATRQIKMLKTEIKALQEVEKDREKGKEILELYRRQELAAAASTGKWFFERSGMKVP